jgi:ATP-dependent RNA helicase DHX33
MNKFKQNGLAQLSVILMSATMDVDEFSLYFNKAPVIYLEGRQFNVNVFHTREPQTDYLYSAISTVIKQKSPHLFLVLFNYFYF